MSYQTLDQEVVKETLTDFAAKVFQHEMDHIQGVLLSTNSNVRTIVFPTPEAFNEHFAAVRTEDAKNYSK